MALDYRSYDTIDGSIETEELEETIRASLAKH